MRKKVALFIFIAGVALSLVIIPVKECTDLGYRGTGGTCAFDDYYFIGNAPALNKGSRRQSRIAHELLLGELGVLSILCILLGWNYSGSRKK